LAYPTVKLFHEYFIKVAENEITKYACSTKLDNLNPTNKGGDESERKERNGEGEKGKG